jgi:phage shock protein PspC (stress-responsive transcriptional regulator)
VNDQDNTRDTPDQGQAPDETPTERLPERAGESARADEGERGEGEAHDGPRRLLRSRSDRMIAGVAGGLGRYFGIDPVIFRIGFAVSVFFGGLGLLAYLALAIFVPTGEGEEIDPAPYQRSRLLGVIVGVALVLAVIPAIGFGFWWGGDWGWGPWGLLWLVIPVAIGLGAYAVLRDRRERGEPFTIGRVLAAIVLVAVAIFVFCCLALAGAFASATGHGAVIAAVVVVIGLLLIGSAFARGARWLIIPAAALATGVGVAAAADLDFPGGIGEETYRPVAVSSLPDDGYELGIGRLEVDLRELDWRPDQVIPLDVDLGIGQIDVAVPESVCVQADLHAGAGELLVAGERNDGVDVDSHRNAGVNATPRLDLTGEVDLGQIRVINDDDADFDENYGHRFRNGSRDDADLDAARAASERACSTEPPKPERG